MNKKDLMDKHLEEYGNFTNSLSSKMTRLAAIADCLPEPKGTRQVAYMTCIHDLIVRGREALKGDPRGTEHAGRVWLLLTWIESSMSHKRFPPAVIKTLKSSGFEAGE